MNYAGLWVRLNLDIKVEMKGIITEQKRKKKVSERQGTWCVSPREKRKKNSAVAVIEKSSISDTSKKWEFKWWYSERMQVIFLE